jgi:hypothetical protein
MLESQVILKLTDWERKNSLLKDADDSSMLYLSSNWSAGGCYEDQVVENEFMDAIDYEVKQPVETRKVVVGPIMDF